MVEAVSFGKDMLQTRSGLNWSRSGDAESATTSLVVVPKMERESHRRRSSYRVKRDAHDERDECLRRRCGRLRFWRRATMLNDDDGGYFNKVAIPCVTVRAHLRVYMGGNIVHAHTRTSHTTETDAETHEHTFI